MSPTSVPRPTTCAIASGATANVMNNTSHRSLESVQLAGHDDALGRLDAWISRQGESDLSRPEAIRRLVDEALGADEKRAKREPARVKRTRKPKAD